MMISQSLDLLNHETDTKFRRMEFVPKPMTYIGHSTRLLKFVTAFGVGGTEKQVVALAEHLDELQFDVSFGCLQRWGPLSGELERRQMPIHEYQIGRLYGYKTVRQQLRLARLMQQDRIEILHSYNFYANVFSLPAARLAGVPVILASIRDLGIYLTPMQERVHNWACRFADHIVVNAEAIREKLISHGIPEEKLSVIRNGVDVSRYGPPNDGESLRTELGLPKKAPIVLMLSRLHRSKGVEYFLEAAAKILTQIPDVYFLVVGGAVDSKQKKCANKFEADTEYRSELEAIADQLGLGSRIRFTGVRKDVPEVLSAAAVSVLPSMSEGTSNTVLESLAAGVPVVATEVGGTPEVIRNGEHGLLVPAGNATALAEAVCAILSNADLAQRLSIQGRAHCVGEFSMDSMVRQTCDLYANLMKSRIPRW